MDVNYGRAVKEYLLARVTLLRIHRFDPQDVQFDDALVSSAVVWFRNRKPEPSHEVEFTFGGSLNQPRVSRRIPAAVLAEESKWTRFPLEPDLRPQAKLTLGDLFTVKRGIATGNNNYFVLTKKQIQDYGLPGKFLAPILPSPRFLKDTEIVADQDGNPVIDPELFLLDCPLPETEIAQRYPELASYLNRGHEQGVDEAYLCRHRTPWYSQENRPPAPILCTYMGRSNGSGRPPFRFILNHSQARATNLYLLMYPKPTLSRELKRQPLLIRVIWQALSELPADALTREGRVYGGGLNKMEPRELQEVSLDHLAPFVPGSASLTSVRKAKQFKLDFLE